MTTAPHTLTRDLSCPLIDRAGTFNPDHVRADFPVLKQSVRGKPLVYLDNAATTQKPQVVIDILETYYSAGNANVTTGSNQPGDRFTEGYAGYEYLLLAGVPDPALIVITTGSSTWEQLAATSRQLRARDLDRVVLVSDPYHSLRLEHIADEVGLDASVSPTDSGSSIRQLVRETAAVSLGRIFGYRRIDNWLGDLG